MPALHPEIAEGQTSISHPGSWGSPQGDQLPQRTREESQGGQGRSPPCPYTPDGSFKRGEVRNPFSAEARV
eukprot:15478250-Alexandrium_andersonii.AAC.1